MPHLFSLISWFMASTNSHINSTIAFLSAWSLQCLPEYFNTSGLAITAYTKGVHFELLLGNIWKGIYYYFCCNYNLEKHYPHASIKRYRIWNIFWFHNSCPTQHINEYVFSLFSISLNTHMWLGRIFKMPVRFWLSEIKRVLNSTNVVLSAVFAEIFDVVHHGWSCRVLQRKIGILGALYCLYGNKNQPVFSHWL